MFVSKSGFARGIEETIPKGLEIQGKTPTPFFYIAMILVFSTMLCVSGAARATAIESFSVSLLGETIVDGGAFDSDNTKNATITINKVFNFLNFYEIFVDGTFSARAFPDYALLRATSLNVGRTDSHDLGIFFPITVTAALDASMEAKIAYGALSDGVADSPTGTISSSALDFLVNIPGIGPENDISINLGPWDGAVGPQNVVGSQTRQYAGGSFSVITMILKYGGHSDPGQHRDGLGRDARIMGLDAQVQVGQVPEPSSLWLLATGLSLICLLLKVRPRIEL